MSLILDLTGRSDLTTMIGFPRVPVALDQGTGAVFFPFGAGSQAVTHAPEWDGMDRDWLIAMGRSFVCRLAYTVFTHGNFRDPIVAS